MSTKRKSLLGEEICWKDLQKYARAFRKGQIPEYILKGSEITYEKPGLFRTQRIPLPKDLQFGEALAYVASQEGNTKRGKKGVSKVKV